MDLSDLQLKKDVLMDLSYLIGVCHDFGKATEYFQNYIKEVDEKKRMQMKGRQETKHGLLSAIFTYFVLQEYLKDLKDQKVLNEPLCDILAVIGYLIIKRHHGNLKDARFEILDLKEDEDIEVLNRQIQSINLNEVEKVYCDLLNVDISYFFNHHQQIVKEILQKKKRIRRLREEENIQYSLITQLLYSVLINSDKVDASGIEIERNRREISSDLVDAYKVIKGYNEPDGKMNNIRNCIYDDVIFMLNELDLKQKIYSLNVPTGTGKTLTSLSFALKLRDKLKREKGFTPKIIYSLPFMSIIDQNFDEFERVFKKVNGHIPTTDILLKHHHLADIFFETKDDEFETTESLFLIEGWNSEIIVTTFVQFFHTLISNKNRTLRKYHNIVNSIVILDEVQSIPHEYWLLFKKLIDVFSRCFNTYFIFVTATQPLIFEPETEIKELVKDKSKYFSEFDRIELIPELESTPFDKFKEIVRKDIEEHKEKDFLVVLNTINSSKELYEYLKDFEIPETSYYYLSTNIIPKERLSRIKKIKAEKGRKIIVSTQLIEAGVDIDVDIVYRDFSTLDSINQVAGRCNRNYSEDKKGLVKVFVLIDTNNNDRKYYQYIYGDKAILINKTSKVLENYSKINEPLFLEITNEYYTKVKDAMADDESEKMVAYLCNLEFESIQKNFRLIKQDYEKIDVFIELDENAKRIWHEYQEIRNVKDPLERKKEFLKIKKDFYDYVISVPKKYANQVGFDEKTGIGYISKVEIDQGIGYDSETGFKRENAGGGSIIC
ncbi:MAG: CRISPR-associated protein Cas3 [Candidatus Syntrophoarchaeum caldarius]|uniref:CRISPR-associated protein Cas3 n=1 Tax=Candidatus Syntropharchaeum caldarium TaxID=1838285 RepID=A0A1F2P9V2_9EURY|nr:MAG: CRISPR-associated protein Cas3 [Candidatus Syntrophoarchaeum caldarius]